MGTPIRYILVFGQECDGKDESLALNKRYRRVLWEVQALYWRLGVPIVIPAGWLRNSSVAHSQRAKESLVELGIPADQIMTPVDHPEQVKPARTTFEEAQALKFTGSDTIVVCELLQLPRGWIMSRALGYQPRLHPVWCWNGLLDVLYQGSLTIYALLDPQHTLMRKSGFFRWIRGKRTPCA